MIKGFRREKMDLDCHEKVKYMSILIGADIVPTKSNFDLFEKGDALELVGRDLLDILNKADYRIFNLEVPLTDTERPILKCGPNLIAPCSTINGLKALGVDLFTLANNHILDQDVQGLNSTRKALDEACIAYLGVGNAPGEAIRPYILRIRERKSEFMLVPNMNFLLFQKCIRVLIPMIRLNHLTMLQS